MAKLTTGARAALPAKTFAGPSRTFPIPDRSHAKAAIIDAPKAVKAGTITAAQKTSIVAKAKDRLDNFGGKAAKPFGAQPKAAAAGAAKTAKINDMHFDRGSVSYK